MRLILFAYHPAIESLMALLFFPTEKTENVPTETREKVRLTDNPKDSFELVLTKRNDQSPTTTSTNGEYKQYYDLFSFVFQLDKISHTAIAIGVVIIRYIRSHLNRIIISTFKYVLSYLHRLAFRRTVSLCNICICSSLCNVHNKVIYMFCLRS